MQFSVNVLTQKSDADSLIKTAERDKRNLEHRLETFELRSVNSAENATELAEDLLKANNELADVVSEISTLPDGDAKEEKVTKKLELELRVRKLTRAGNQKGALTTLESEYDAALISQQLIANKAFLDAVNARKAEL